MRYFRPLPPLLRVASILGLLFALADIALIIAVAVVLVTSLSSLPHSPADFVRVSIIAANLGMLSGACSFAVNSYNMRFRRSGGGPFPLNSWQSQVRAIVLLSAPPLCGIALAAFIAPARPDFYFVGLFAAIAISALAAVVLLVANFVLLASLGPSQTPQT